MISVDNHIISKPVHGRTVFAVLSALAVICMMVLAACGGGSSPQQTTTSSKFGGNITVGLNTTDVTTLDPLKSSSFYDRQVMLNMYDTLVKLSPQSTILPDLATSWSYTTPTQLVFTLRTDVKFWDGTPFNADAVVFNIQRYLSNPTEPRYSEISTVQSVNAIDSSHVQFVLKKPFSPLLATLTDRSGMILSPTAIKKLGDNLANAPTGAGSGPFMFVQWSKGDFLLLKRNPHYWLKDSDGNQLPYLQSIRYRPFANESVEYANLQTGTINVADVVAPADVAQAKTNSSIVYKQEPSLSFFGVMLNVKAPPLNNVHVRRAIEWGVNRQEIVTSALKNVGVVSQGPISPPSWAYDKNFAPYSYDVNKAKAELAQAGTAKVSFTMKITSGSPLNSQIAQFLQSELQPVGITINIQQETFDALLSDTNPNTHNFQAALLGWSGRPDPDGNIYSWFHTGGGFNSMQYSNPQVDSLLDAARATSDQAQRTSDYQQAQQAILQDAPYVFLYHGVNQQATTTNIKNFTLLPTGILMFTSVYTGS